MTYGYTREKLFQAVDVLVGDGTVQERLASAATYLIRLHEPENDFPPELQEEFKAIKHALTKEQAIGNEGNIQATVDKLSNEEGRKLASRILELYIGLRGGL